MDQRKIRQAVERWGVRELNVEEESYYDYRPYDSFSYRNDDYRYATAQARRRYNVKLTIPSEQFEKLIDRAEEFEDLMHDRETKELIQQARFLYRLKYGTTF